MKQLRVVEHYVSIQGEGPRTGEKTFFIRFAGCNMRCPGWPCDTPQAIDPKIWVRTSRKFTWSDLFQLVWLESGIVGSRNVSLTGGEPFMQDNEALKYLVWNLVNCGQTVEVWTNGSYIFPPWALRDLHFILDWKLEGSGERNTGIVAREVNALHLDGEDVIKFVVKSTADLEEAKIIWESLTRKQCVAQFNVTAAWDLINNQDIVTFIMKHKLPWRLGVQLHKYVFGSLEGVASSAGGHEWART